MKTCRTISWWTVPVLGLVAALVIISPGAGATNSGSPRIQQGQTVYVNDTVDISGVVPPYPQLAYWDGVDMYSTPPTYTITLPVSHGGYYNFYVDPAIFATRLGRWYKYDSTIGYEPKGNNLAFVVVEPSVPILMNTAPASVFVTIITPVPTISAPVLPVTTVTPAPALTPAPPIFSEGETAGIISLIIVGLVFGFFTLSESEFWRGK